MRVKVEELQDQLAGVRQQKLGRGATAASTAASPERKPPAPAAWRSGDAWRSGGGGGSSGGGSSSSSSSSSSSRSSKARAQPWVFPPVTETNPAGVAPCQWEWDESALKQDKQRFKREVRVSATECIADPMESLAWLPDARWYADYRRDHWSWQPDRDALWSKIRKVQFPRDCRAAGWRPHLMKWSEHGFGYNVHNLVYLAARHWDQGIPVIAGNNGYRFSDGGRCGQGWSCHLAALTGCAIEEVPLEHVELWGKYSDWAGAGADAPQPPKTLAGVCKPQGTFRIASGRCECKGGTFPWEGGNGCRVPPHKRQLEPGEEVDGREQEVWEDFERDAEVFMAPNHKMGSVMAPGVSDWGMNDRDPACARKTDGLLTKNSFFWWMAHHLWLLMSQAPARKSLDAYVASLGLSRNCMAVHVRHGDSCFDKTIMNAHRVCRPWSEYLGHIKAVDRKYGPFKHIYVASDDHRVIAEAKATLPADQLVMQDLDRTFFDLPETISIDDSEKFDSTNAIDNIAKDIWAMASCEAYVGTQSSSVSWVTSALMVAQKGHYVPMVSLDDAYNEPRAVGRFF